jgi:transposase-like protein
MVLAVRRGSSLRDVAQRFGVSHGTVRYWVERVRGQRLDRADYTDQPCGSRRAANRTGKRIERRVLSLRKSLRERSPLGEHGAVAIQRELAAGNKEAVPCVRTIGRILQRHGVLDGRRRIRHPAPAKGWYLPLLASRQVEVDSFDTITDLIIQGGQDVTVLNAISLHGGLPASWPEARITAKITTQRLLDHWQMYGLPGYAKFDNDTVFQGAHQWPDSFGRVTRLCLQLEVIPVFVPPREPGFQAEIESFNGRWQRLVWHRFIHRDLSDLCRRSAQFLDALRQHTAQRISAAPERRSFPADFEVNYTVPLQGTLIFLRRADAQGRITCLGHHWLVDRNWPHRLVRVEVDLSAERVRCFALRRRDPPAQPLLKTFAYHPPSRPFTQ